MEPETSLDTDIAAAVRRCAEFAQTIADLSATATTDRSSTDLSIAAKAQRALANAEFAQTTPARAITAAAKQVVMTLSKRSGALESGVAAAVDIVVAIVRLQALQEAEDARLAEKSNDHGDAGIPVEAQRLIRKLLKAGVPPSAFDLITEQELPIVARLLWEKNEDYKHIGPGLWVAICRAGFIDFPVAGLSDDEAAAVQASTGAEEAFVAKKFLQAIVGKKLEISPAFALALVSNYHAPEKSRGLRLTSERIDSDNVEKDLQFILDAVGLGEAHRARAASLWEQVYYPQIARFDQQRADERKARSDREAQYVPAARRYREVEAKRRAERRERQRAAEQVDEDEDDSSGLADGEVEFHRAPFEDAQFSENSEAHSQQWAVAGDRQRDIVKDRVLYEQAIGRLDDADDRHIAGWLAGSKDYRARVRNRGIDVPEPAVSEAGGPTDQRNSASPQSPPLEPASTANPPPRGETRAERNARMKAQL